MARSACCRPVSYCGGLLRPTPDGTVLADAEDGLVHPSFREQPSAEVALFGTLLKVGSWRKSVPEPADLVVSHPETTRRGADRMPGLFSFRPSSAFSKGECSRGGGRASVPWVDPAQCSYGDRRQNTIQLRIGAVQSGTAALRLGIAPIAGRCRSEGSRVSSSRCPAASTGAAALARLSGLRSTG